MTVNAAGLVNTATPTISAHPQSATYLVGNAAAALLVTSYVMDGGTLRYQWYSNIANSNAGGTAISDANLPSYTPPTSAAGTLHYYVEVTNTNSSATGEKTAVATSSPAIVKVSLESDATGVETVAGSVLKVYPNPITNGVLYVETGGLKAGEKIALYTLTGGLAGVYEPTGKTTLIDLSHLSQGVYIVKAGAQTAKVIK